MSGYDFPAKTAYLDPQSAANYDSYRRSTRLRRRLENMELDAIQWAIKKLPKSYRVLDVPCGTGRLLQPLIRHFAFVQGVDLSSEMLNIARSRYAGVQNVAFCKADATALPFQDDEFDCVSSVRFFGHTPPDVRLGVLREMRRVTRYHVVAIVYARDRLINLRKRLRRIVRPDRYTWYPFSSRKEVIRTFHKAGLSVQTIRSLMPMVMESRLVIATKR